MTSYNTSKAPMGLSDFLELALSAGWTLDPDADRQSPDDIVLTNADDEWITAYEQGTVTDVPHVGFRGWSGDLVSYWEEGSIELRLLEGSFDDNDATDEEIAEAKWEVNDYYPADAPAF